MSEPRPDIVENDHMCFLDDLRDSGATNMFGASPYLQEEFGLNRDDCRTILSYWMASFSERNE